MVPCHFHFILLPKASHMAKPKVQGWEIHSAPVGLWQKAGTQEEAGNWSSLSNLAQWSLANKIKLDTATWRFGRLCEYVGVGGQGKGSRRALRWRSLQRHHACTESILTDLTHWSCRGCWNPLSPSQSCDKASQELSHEVRLMGGRCPTEAETHKGELTKGNGHLTSFEESQLIGEVLKGPWGAGDMPVAHHPHQSYTEERIME